MCVDVQHLTECELQYICYRRRCFVTIWVKKKPIMDVSELVINTVYEKMRYKDAINLRKRKMAVTQESKVALKNRVFF